MSHTKELLQKLKSAVLEGRLPAQSVPLEDVKQCVYTELQVNRSTFAERQYTDVVNQFEALCADLPKGEGDRTRILLFLDAMMLCVDMLSQTVYTLANREYWNYKHPLDKEDPEVASIISYIDREHRIDLISYDFVREYQKMPVKVYWDEADGMGYVPYGGRRMFFPRGWDEERIAGYFRSVVMEQDARSPHCYANGNCGVKEGDIVVDAGAAEGIFALDHIEQASRIYLIEADRGWIEALERTFSGDRDKVQIIYGFLDSYDEGEHVSIDGLFRGKDINYIKMDIEGAEKSALAGAVETLDRQVDIRCAICSYHCREDEREIRNFLEKHGMKTETTRGFMCPDWTMDAYLEAELRRGIVFGHREEGETDYGDNTAI